MVATGAHTLQRSKTIEKRINPTTQIYPRNSQRSLKVRIETLLFVRMHIPFILRW